MNEETHQQCLFDRIFKYTVKNKKRNVFVVNGYILKCCGCSKSLAPPGQHRGGLLSPRRQIGSIEYVITTEDKGKEHSLDDHHLTAECDSLSEESCLQPHPRQEVVVEDHDGDQQFAEERLEQIHSEPRHATFPQVLKIAFPCNPVIHFRQADAPRLTS